MELLETIEWLSAFPGVSGDEAQVRSAIESRLKDVCNLHVDALGNLIATTKGGADPKNKLLFSAHMDEVGFIITQIEDSGFLRFAPCGGIDERVVDGKRLEIGASRVPGVVGGKAVHHLDYKEKKKPRKIEAMRIDIGAKDKKEAEALVRLGDRAVFYAPSRKLGLDKRMGRAFDDRAGCALLIHLAESALPFRCHFAFTVQEETGCVGGSTAGYQVAPDIAVVVETTTASDVSGIPPDKVVCKLGGGPVVSFMDKGTVYDSALYAFAMSRAERLGIPVQTKEGIFGGNESRALQVSRDGVRVMGVSLPCRYLHSPSCVLQESDIADAFRLLEALARELGEL